MLGEVGTCEYPGSPGFYRMHGEGRGGGNGAGGCGELYKEGGGQDAFTACRQPGRIVK